MTTSSCDFESNLLAAAYDGDLEGLCAAIDEGADANYRDSSGYTALYWVSFKGIVDPSRAELARCLISAGADVNAELPYGGGSILSTACQAGNVEIVKLLIESGADIEDYRDGRTPLINSIYGGDIEVVKYLLAKGADAKKAGLDGETPMDVAVKLERFDIAELITE